MRDALRRKTAPGVLAERARGTPHAVAYRAKKLGIYRERTWREYAARVSRVADGFANLGQACSVGVGQCGTVLMSQ